jgi:hypothetical protein
MGLGVSIDEFVLIIKQNNLVKNKRVSKKRGAEMAIKYKREIDMIRPITQLAKFLLQSDDAFVFLECAGTLGIADIVFVEFDRQAIIKRYEVGLSPQVDSVKLKILLALDNKQPKNVAQISSSVGYSSSYVRSAAINPLIAMGLIHKVKEGYQSFGGYTPVTKKIVAIEAKREDWTHGLYQARRYRRYAQKVFVALDNAFAERVNKYKHTFQKQGIGVIYADAETDTAIVSQMPRWREPLASVDNALLGERLWSAAMSKGHFDTRNNFAILDSFVTALF